MGISQSLMCRTLCGLVIIGGLTATGCKSGPSFGVPSMPSMAWWQKDKSKSDLAGRTVEQPQPPSSAFDPSPSLATQNQNMGSSYDAGFNRTANLNGSPTYAPGGGTSGVAPTSYPQSPYSPTGTPSYGATQPSRPPYGSDPTGGMSGVPSQADYRQPPSYNNSYNNPPAYGGNPSYGSGNQNWSPSSSAPPQGPTNNSTNNSTTIANPYAGGSSTPPAGFGGSPGGAGSTAPPAGSGASGGTLTYPNTGAAPITSSAGRSLPPSLSQSQGTYRPGSTGMMGSDVRTAVQPPNSAPPSTAPTYSAPQSSGGSFQVPGGGSFPGGQPSTGLYR